MVLTCISLIANDAGKSFCVLICHLYTFLGKISFPVFCQFSNWLACFTVDFYC